MGFSRVAKFLPKIALMSAARMLDISPANRTTPLNPVPATDHRVPHISLVFREMWDTTSLNLMAVRSRSPKLTGYAIHSVSCAIPVRSLAMRSAT
jgi:hypothetical protein